MAVYEVPVDEIRAHVDPLKGEIWKCEPIGVSEVAAAIDANEYDERPWNEVKDTLNPAEHRNYHIARIAFLASSPPETDDSTKIAIAISPDRIWLYDENHRVAAVIVRGDATLAVVIALIMMRSSPPTFLPRVQFEVFSGANGGSDGSWRIADGERRMRCPRIRGVDAASCLRGARERSQAVPLYT